jgi:hypothetical protein
MLVESQLGDFLVDYPNADMRAQAFDHQVSSDASKFSSEYQDLVALAARQAFGSLQITLSLDSRGNWNLSDVLTFMKDLNSQNQLVDLHPSHRFLYNC